MAAISLYELNEFIRRLMALNFPEAIWVRAELAQVGQSRGHRYLDVIQKEEEGEDIIAKANVVIWEREYNRLRRRIGKSLEDILQEGMEVLLEVKVDFHEQYGLKLIVQDIDPAFTLGKLEIKRRATIDKLRQLNLLGKNTQTALPEVIQKIAIISSVKAAGFKDYLNHLSTNSYGYTFQNQLLNASMQGRYATKEIMTRLDQIALTPDKFDCVVIIRGGGAKMDLLAFDDLELSKKAADFPIPILTGVGHDIDESVLDMVVYKALKTPTAVADFIIENNMLFESKLEEVKLFLQQITNMHITQSDRLIEGFEQQVKFSSESILNKSNSKLDQVIDKIPLLKTQQLQLATSKLTKLEEMIKLLDPNTSLKRGFTLTTLNNKIIRNVDEVAEGEEIVTQFFDGTLKSKVVKNGKK